MKLLKVFLGLAVGLGLFAPAMASPSVTFDGNAKVRFGSQYVRVDGNDDAAMMFMADQRMDQRQAYFYGVMFAAHKIKGLLVDFINYETPAVFLSNDADSFNLDLKAYMASKNAATSGAYLTLYNNYITAGSTPKEAKYLALEYMCANIPQFGNTIGTSQVSLLALTNSLTTIQTSWKKVGINANNLAKYLNGSNRSRDSKSLWFGLKNKQDVRLNTNIKDERLTAKVSVDYQASTPRYDTKTTPSLECKEAWVAYDFGPLKVTYATVGAQGRWDGDIYDIGDGYSAEGSLDFIIKPFANAGDLFVTIISDHSAEKAKYEVFNNRIVPITQLGYEINNDDIDFKAGGVLDWYKGSDSSTGAYKGWMAFASATFKFGKIGELAPGSMAFGFAGAYGQNIDKFGGMNPDDTDCLVLSVVTKQDDNLHRNTDCHGEKRDAQVRGLHAYSAVRLWEGALFYTGWYVSQARFVGVNPYDETDFIDYKWMTAYKMEFALIQFFSKNFNVKVATGYESYSLRPHSNYGVIPLFAPNPKLGGWGFETLVEAEYLF